MSKVLVTVFFIVRFSVLSAQDTTRMSLLFAGDIMGHDSQIAAAYDPVKQKYDYSNCFAPIRPYIEFADLAIGNLEVTLAGPPYKGYPQFSSPDALAVALKEIGFDVLVTANNHCVDRGRKGLERTNAVLDSFSIAHTGTFNDSISRAKDYPLMLYKNGFTIALLNYTYGTNGLPVYKPTIVNLLDTAIMRRDFLKAKASKPDVIIVFTHWGAEYQSHPSAVQKNLAEFCFKHGANLVIGAHPHVLQPMEWRKDKNQFIVYSLGNFVSGQRKRYTDGGAMAYVELEKIRFSPDSSVTVIDSAGYFLQWVYRTADARKEYQLLPVPSVEKENGRPIADAASKEAYRLFVSDSRELYGKYNKNTPEIRSVPEPPRTYYRVLLTKTAPGEDPWKILTSPHDYIWGVEPEVDEDGNILWLSGKFSNRAQAERYSLRYLTQHKDARVLQYVEGKRLTQ